MFDRGFAQVCDYRLVNAVDLKPRVYRVLLEPDNVTVCNDLRHIWRTLPDLSESDVCLIEKGMLLAMQPVLCLDANPRVGMVAAALARNSLRCHVWHQRNARPATSSLRRPMDERPLKRVKIVARAVREDPLVQSKLAYMAKQHRAAAWRARPVSVHAIVQQQQQLAIEEEEHADRGIQSILQLCATRGGGDKDSSASTSDIFVSPLPAASSPTPPTNKSKGKNAGTGMLGSSYPHHMTPALAKMMPAQEVDLKQQAADRAMKFRKELHSGNVRSHAAGTRLQEVSLWVQEESSKQTKAKVASSYNVYITLVEKGRDESSVEMTLPAVPVGNSKSAVVYGAQQAALMQRFGWQTVFDSHKSREGQRPGILHTNIVFAHQSCGTKPRLADRRRSACDCETNIIIRPHRHCPYAPI